VTNHRLVAQEIYNAVTAKIGNGENNINCYARQANIWRKMSYLGEGGIVPTLAANR